MSKIIKPLLDENGQHIRRELKEGDYYWGSGSETFIRYNLGTSELEHFVYYEEKWKPKENEIYWYYCFTNYRPIATYFNSYRTYKDKERVEIGNCFKTSKEAGDINNILKVLDNMKEYYQKQREVKND